MTHWKEQGPNTGPLITYSPTPSYINLSLKLKQDRNEGLEPGSITSSEGVAYLIQHSLIACMIDSNKQVRLSSVHGQWGHTCWTDINIGLDVGCGHQGNQITICADIQCQFIG